MAKLALAIICAPTDREAELLDRLLGGPTKDNIQKRNKNISLDDVGGLAEWVDGIFITITGKNEKCEEIAKKYGAQISYIKWEDQYADARNFNFSQVPDEYEYICWYDCDDIVVHPEKHRDAIEHMEVNNVDAALSHYHYDFDEYGNCITQHLKSRILKNDGTFTWMSAVHEDFAYERTIVTHYLPDCYPLHFTDETRIRQSAERNLRIAELETKRNPKDPHTYWNLANTYYLVSKLEEAKKIYLQFLKVSDSLEERFIAWYRLAGVYFAQRDYSKAIQAALECISMRPWYPDGYFMLAETYFNLNEFRHARKFVEIGMQQEPPTNKLIVWNPLDYTYNPHLLSMKIFLGSSLFREAFAELKKCLKIRPRDKGLRDLYKQLKPKMADEKKVREIYEKAKDITDKDEIKKLLEEIPEGMKYHPAIAHIRNTHFVKETSSGKDLVIYCSLTTQEWNPDVVRNIGAGGSEEAVVQLSERLKQRGFNVTVYANTPQSQEYDFDGVKWLPFMAWNPKDKQDVVVLWRHPSFVDNYINADKVYVDIHDVISAAEFTNTRLSKITKVLFKSNTQRGYYPNIPDEKCAVIPHGLDIEEFDSQRDIKRNPYLILNTSSPDRSLKTSLRAINLAYIQLSDELKKKVKFAWHYGFDVWDSDFVNNEKMLDWKKEAIETMDGLKNRGIMTWESGTRLSQKEITKRYLGAGLLLYPSEFFEIGFISGIKAMLAGCIPLTTDVFAQGEFCKGIILHSDVNYENWAKNIEDGDDYGIEDVNIVADKIVEYLNNVEKYESLRQEVIDHARQFSWDKTADSWVSLING